MNEKIESPVAETLWNVADVARYLRTSRSWVYKAAERNAIPAVRIGSLLRFQPQAVREFVASLSSERPPARLHSIRKEPLGPP